MLSLVFSSMKSFFSWFVNNKEFALVILLALFCAFTYMSLENKNNQIKKLTNKSKSLTSTNKNLQSEMSGLTMKAHFQDGDYNILINGKNGVISKLSGYVPQEGSIDIKEFQIIKPNSQYALNEKKKIGIITSSIINPSSWLSTIGNTLHETFVRPTIKTDDGLINIKNKGVCFYPGVAVYYSNGIVPVLDSKLFFYDRWSFGIGSSEHSFVFWGSRHIDDLSFNIIKNAELSLGYSLEYNNLSGGMLMIGVRDNL